MEGAADRQYEQPVHCLSRSAPALLWTGWARPGLPTTVPIGIGHPGDKIGNQNFWASRW